MAFNCPRIHGASDGTSEVELTRAQIEGRQSIRRLLAFCRRYLPGCENAFISQVAPMVGVREGRRIIGEYVLTLDDVLQGRKFPDAVARNRYPVDIHVPRDVRRRRTVGGGSDGGDSGGDKGGGNAGDSLEVGVHAPPEGDFHEIPYRCLVPLEVDGLLVAGRSISATFEAQSSIRIQPNCHSLGQAAGVAAALACREGTSPRALDGRRVRELLRAEGANV